MEGLHFMRAQLRVRARGIGSPSWSKGAPAIRPSTWREVSRVTHEEQWATQQSINAVNSTTKKEAVMNRRRFLTIRVGVMGLIGGLVLASSLSALANELWVAPAKSPADKQVGNWAVNHLGPMDSRTHFGFHVPGDITAFTKAVVVLIPPATGALVYNLDISVAKSAQSQNAFTNSSPGLATGVTANVLTELDVSSIFPGNLLVPDGTYVSLNFSLPAGTTQVLGMRFEYVGPGEQNLFGTGTNWAVDGHGGDCTLGEIILSAGAVANGWVADGRLLSIAQNSALFSLLGTTYGGDGRTTFAIPDLRGTAPNKLTYSICHTGIFPTHN